jgi:predicted RNase H-like HicB family nuclease
VKTEHASLSNYRGITVLAAMLKIEIEREEDGRWIGEVPALPGVLAYGKTAAEARTRAIALALRVIADRIDNGEPQRVGWAKPPGPAFGGHDDRLRVPTVPASAWARREERAFAHPTSDVIPNDRNGHAR